MEGVSSAGGFVLELRFLQEKRQLEDGEGITVFVYSCFNARENRN